MDVTRSGPAAGADSPPSPSAPENARRNRRNQAARLQAQPQPGGARVSDVFAEAGQMRGGGSSSARNYQVSSYDFALRGTAIYRSNNVSGIARALASHPSPSVSQGDVLGGVCTGTSLSVIKKAVIGLPLADCRPDAGFAATAGSAAFLQDKFVFNLERASFEALSSMIQPPKSASSASALGTTIQECGLEIAEYHHLASGDRPAFEMQRFHANSGDDVTFYVIGQNYPMAGDAIVADHCMAAIIDTTQDGSPEINVFDVNRGMYQFDSAAHAMNIFFTPDDNRNTAESYDFFRVKLDVG